MTRQPEPTFLDARAVDQLAGLVFELAAQLHAEQAKRITLEAALRSVGALSGEALAAAAASPDNAGTIAAALDRSQRRLLDVILERDDAGGPLRHEKETP